MAQPAGFVGGNTYHLVRTRDAGTEEVIIYLDGVPIISFTDSAGDAVFSGPDHIIHLFQDDLDLGQSEAGPGVVELVRIYSTPLSAENVDALYNEAVGPPVPSLYDQRGIGFDRVRNGAADAGAFELQSVASADFDNDGDVDGLDFLAWQRGFGIVTPNAQKEDGDADDDQDVDAVDLSVWEEQYGTEGPMETLQASTSAAAHSASSEDCIDHAPVTSALVAVMAAFVDAALASYVAPAGDVRSESTYWLLDLASPSVGSQVEAGDDLVGADDVSDSELLDRVFAELPVSTISFSHTNEVDSLQRDKRDDADCDEEAEGLDAFLSVEL